MPVENPTARVEYRTIEDAPGYRFGDDGTAWSCLERVPNKGKRGCIGVIGSEWKLLKVSYPRGYAQVSIRRNGKNRAENLHKLILEAFVGPRPPGLQCRHLDDDRRNNRLTNLCWGTAKENQADCSRNGHRKCGDEVSNSKLNDELVESIRISYALGEKDQVQLSREHGVSQAEISAMVRGNIWKHAGGPITKRGRKHNTLTGKFE